MKRIYLKKALHNAYGSTVNVQLPLIHTIADYV